MTEWLLVLLGVALTAGTAVFVAAEFALVTLDPALVDQEVQRTPDRRSRSVRRALAELSTQLSGAQVGITVTTILLGYTTQPAITDLLAGALGRNPRTEGIATALAAVGAILLVNGFSMLFGELVPKNLALSRPLATARAVAPLQRGFTTALRPVIVVLNDSANGLLRRMGVEPREELSGGRSAQELASLVRRSAEVGTLDEGTATLLTNSIELDTLTAVDVMTDRTRMEVVRRDHTAADVVARARATGHSRFPVIDTSHDDVVGLVHLRRAIAVPYDRRADVPAAALMDDAPRVPETVRLGPLLVELREHGMQMAVVVDEYGGTAGVVTLEDVVEELVGEVADEHDPRRAGVHRTADDSWSVPGLLRPDELEEATGVVVPDEGAYETLGGLVMALLGRVPHAGDVVQVPGVLLQVEQMDGRRVERLRVRPHAPADGAGA
ncbi:MULTISPECIES: hemolysin family protein [unclassified Actinotalea]|uniref:hemolysin family protein n=1 Tax=unclassified Actinotalea TaxID=2638618 RepID=UPI0015F7166B|nr:MULTISPECIES: hemolysin family protein [unclassified Actinotalea]